MRFFMFLLFVIFFIYYFRVIVNIFRTGDSNSCFYMDENENRKMNFLEFNDKFLNFNIFYRFKNKKSLLYYYNNIDLIVYDKIITIDTYISNLNGKLNSLDNDKFSSIKSTYSQFLKNYESEFHNNLKNAFYNCYENNKLRYYLAKLHDSLNALDNHLNESLKQNNDDLMNDSLSRLNNLNNMLDDIKKVI